MRRAIPVEAHCIFSCVSLLFMKCPMPHLEEGVLDLDKTLPAYLYCPHQFVYWMLRPIVPLER